MFNIANRFQNAANLALTSSLVVIGIIIVVTFVQLISDNVWNINTTSIGNVTPRATLKHSFSYGAYPKKPKENSKITFDLQADLRPLFNWNTKQIFVYLTAEYPGKSDGSSNKVTYWDAIITSRDKAVIDLTKQGSKYSVWDVEKSFREREATLRLEWNIQPHIGPLVYGETSNSTLFTFSQLEKKKVQQ